MIYSQLKPYIERLDGAEWYQRQIDEIMSAFAGLDEYSDDALDAKYLMGYSLQRRELYKKNNEEAKP